MPDITIQSDATPRRWGFTMEGRNYYGVFDDPFRIRKYHINTIELLTVYMALLCVEKENITIQILCDNTTAIQIIQKGGSIIYHLNSIAELIWKRAILKRWTIRVAHIKGSYNVLADMLSRDTPLSTEWSLHRRDFQKILDLNQDLEVDLFATSLNAQLQEFVSPCPDQGAVTVDALTIDWGQWDHLYLFPPVPLIPKVLAKLEQTAFKSAILITPDTPGRPWFMALQLQRIPSTPMTVILQQIVINRLVRQPQPSKIRVWQL